MGILKPGKYSTKESIIPEYLNTYRLFYGLYFPDFEILCIIFLIYIFINF